MTPHLTDLVSFAQILGQCVVGSMREPMNTRMQGSMVMEMLGDTLKFFEQVCEAQGERNELGKSNALSLTLDKK